jgi:hypothetical protein
MQIHDVISQALNAHHPDMDAPTNAATTASLVALDAIRIANGRLYPGAVEAIAGARHMAPKLFEALAQEAAQRQTTPAGHTIAYFAALGTTVDAAIADGAADVSDLAAANEYIRAQRPANTYPGRK